MTAGALASGSLNLVSLTLFILGMGSPPHPVTLVLVVATVRMSPLRSRHQSAQNSRISANEVGLATPVLGEKGAGTMASTQVPNDHPNECRNAPALLCRSCSVGPISPDGNSTPVVGKRCAIWVCWTTATMVVSRIDMIVPRTTTIPALMIAGSWGLWSDNGSPRRGE